ncbi:NUDIX hydrolase [Edwardsiella piscicida]|uniref:NUDIX domain-containing protein n=1 Tax=Edwardsiella piscicida TaxID=1263550 RepID=UPI00093461F1|nr:NUDIX hydrolase [Edwardsiella piscicida]EKS7792478.1 NUDIX hydrolase [Edwardsiella piscicida]EKS7813412.1 NUDIX hydrolase [Edwardsiella piscicida]ELM3724233.1 NUDIX hydrolase [Edwardsiella piscicida]ELM3730166.1 NUDIX hydrolase [Edwardsiella piscicida]ELV7537401.1 NUDIX hydrolase [Edwardsiella piscicida]
MLKPHVTVACVVQAEGRFLIVEETIDGQPRWNQPAGHLEAGETLLQAASRELWEESGLRADPQHLLQIFQWVAPDATPFLRFTFAIDLPRMVDAVPHDDDIDRCLWLDAAQILRATQLRSPLVAESLRCYQRGARYPLALLCAYPTQP